MDKAANALTEEITRKFGIYQWYQLIIMWWCQITITCFVVFMVFGGSTNTICIQNDTLGVNKTCAESVPEFFSFVFQWNLTGSLIGVPTILAAVQMAGALVGTLIGGQVADWYGRKLNTWVFYTLTVLFGLASMFSPNWQVMLVFRFFIGVCTGCYDSSAIIFMMEWVNPEIRFKVQLSMDCVNSVAFCWFGLIAWLCQDWKTLTLVCSLQMLPCVVGFFWTLETPKWCVTQGKKEKLLKSVRALSKWNKHFDKSALTSEIEEMQLLPVEKTQTTTYLSLFRTPTLVKYSLLLMFSFLITGSVGYLLIFNVPNLAGNEFSNFALLGSVNVGAALMAALAEHVLQLGRRVLHQICLNSVWIFLTVIVVLYALNLQVQYSQVLIAAALLGSMFSFPLWVVCNLYSGELFPTQIRNKGSGLGSMAARAGGVLAPLILYLMHVWNPLPFLIVVVLCIVNVIVVFLFMPETRNHKLPEYVADKL